MSHFCFWRWSKVDGGGGEGSTFFYEFVLCPSCVLCSQCNIRITHNSDIGVSAVRR